MKKAIIYTRVSTTDQAENGFSLARQKEECIEFARQNNYEITQIFEERGESAKTTDRTQLQTLLQYCSKNKKEVNTLIVWKFDRLSRNVEDHYTLMNFFNKLSIVILSATENNDNSATGKLTRNILQAFSQFENDQKSERVIAGMKQALLEGKWLWRAPYGYNLLNGNLVHNPIEAPIVKRIYELFTKGLYRQSQIIDYLAKENINMTTGQVHSILHNMVYCGKIYSKTLCDDIIKGNFEPIISEEIFLKAESLLNGNTKIISPYAYNNPEYPLRHFIYCPCCGAPLTASKSTGRGNKKYAYYHCYNKKCKTQVRIAKNKLEKMFTDLLINIKPNYDNLKDFKSKVKETYKTSIKDTINTQQKLNNDIKTLNDKKNKLLDFYLDNKFSEEDFKTYKIDIDSKIADIKIKLTNLEIPKDDFNKCLDFVCNALENLDKLWIESDLDTKQRIQQLIFPKGLVYENNGFRNAENSSLFTKKGGLLPPDFNMVPPGEFESPSTP